MNKERLFIILNEYIEDRFKIQNNGGYIEIIEKNDAKCKNIKIYTSKKTFSIRFDIDEEILSYFKNIENLKIKNDGIVLFNKGDYLIILLIELKSTNPKGYLKQFKSGRNLIEFILKQINLFSDFSIDFEKILYRGILFRIGRRIPNKGTTKKINNIKFENREGLVCTTLECNKEYKLQEIKNAI